MESFTLSYYLLIPLISLIYLTIFYLLPTKKKLLSLSPTAFFLLLSIIISTVGSLLFSHSGSALSVLIQNPIAILSILFTVVVIGLMQIFIILPGLFVFYFSQMARGKGKRNAELVLLISYFLVAGLYGSVLLLNSN